MDTDSYTEKMACEDKDGDLHVKEFQRLHATNGS